MEYLGQSHRLKTHVFHAVVDDILGRGWIFALQLHSRTLKNIMFQWFDFES